MPVIAPPALPPNILDLISGNDSLFTSSLGNWTNVGGTLTRDTTATWLVSGGTATLKFVTTASGQHIDVPIPGTYVANQRVDALLWLHIEEAGNHFSDTYTLTLGLQGTDVGTYGPFAVWGTWTGSTSPLVWVPVFVRWFPTATRTGVTLRLNRSAGTTSLSAHISWARVAGVANAGDPGLLATVNPNTGDTSAAIGVAQGQLGAGPDALRAGAAVLLSSTNIGAEILSPQGNSDVSATDANGAEVDLSAPNTTAADLSSAGVNVEVGPDNVGIWVSEKDSNTIQIYPDYSGGYDVELHDRGTGKWKSVNAGGTVTKNLTDMAKLAAAGGSTGQALVKNSATDYDTGWATIGSLFTHFTDVSNGTTVETDLYSDTTAAGQLATNGQQIKATYAGTYLGHATALQDIRVYFGGTAIFDSGALAVTAASNWTVTATIIRVSGTVVRYTVRLDTPGLATEVYEAVGELTGLTLSNTNVLKITAQASGTGAASGQTTAKLGVVDFGQNAGAVAAAASPFVCQGRLTLTTLTPVTTADVTAATTIYWTPFRGSQISLYDGSAWATLTFSELSASLSGLTASLPYDVFAYNNAGVVAIELLAWTNATTRATALVLQDGIYSKSGALTRRYLGTVCMTGTTGQTEDSLLHRLVWNYYNRVERKVRVTDSTDSWTSSATGWRAWNGSNSNRCDVVVGVSEDPVTIVFSGLGKQSGGATLMLGIGLDSTSTNSADIYPGLATVNIIAFTTATYLGYPSIGYHYFQLLEYDNQATTTFYGDTGAPSPAGGAVGSLLG